MEKFIYIILESIKIPKSKKLIIIDFPAPYNPNSISCLTDNKWLVVNKYIDRE